jgi:hypothetical protein
MMTTFLVIRCSNIDGVNPIEEVDHVIGRLGYCWFGKYGQPILSIERKFSSNVRVVLAGGVKMGMKGTGALYELRDWSFSTPPAKEYPPYYKSKLSRIGTWLKLERAKEADIATSDLIVKSSRQALSKVLSDSMGGYFWCARAGEDK